MIVEKIVLLTGGVATSYAAISTTQSSQQAVSYAAASAIVGVIMLAIALVRMRNDHGTEMRTYGREQGEMKTKIDQLIQAHHEFKEAQRGQLSASEIRLMMEKLDIRFGAHEKRVDSWMDAVGYDLRRLRESRHEAANAEHRRLAERYLQSESESVRKEDLR